MSRSAPNFVMLADEGAPASVDQLRRQALRLLNQGADHMTREHHSQSAQTRTAAPAAAPSEPPPARAVMIGVITMPAVFLVVVMVALALFGKPAARSKTEAAAAFSDTLEQPPATAATPASLAAAHSRFSGPVISLGEDTRVVSISLDGERVAMHVESPAGQQIVIYDYEKGRIVAQAPIETASIEAVDSLSMLTGAPPQAPAMKPRGDE
ncbi:MAG: hypothetical protein ACOZAA_10940 [Pseudomonadota bacterium]